MSVIVDFCEKNKPIEPKKQDCRPDKTAILFMAKTAQKLRGGRLDKRESIYFLFFSIV